MYDRGLARYARLPVAATLVRSRELVTPSLRSTECLTSATGNWVELPGALYIMAVVDDRTALPLNQSGKVRNLKAGESRGYKLLPCTYLKEGSIAPREWGAG